MSDPIIPLPDEPAPVKPGWQTTEAWTTLLSSVLAAALAFHLVSAADASVLTDAVTKAVGAVLVFMTQAGVVMRYIKSRTALKQQASPNEPVAVD